MSDNSQGKQSPLTHMLTESFDALMRQCMFCLPGKVTAFEASSQLAQVQCGIQRLVEGEGPRTIPVIENVPVCFPGDGEFYFWHQITPGETEGLIHFSQRAIDTWIDQGGPAAPHSTRQLSAKDAFFVPGVRSQPGVIPDFQNDGCGLSNYDQTVFLHLKSDGDIDAEAGTYSITGDLSVDGNITTTGNVEADGDVTAQGNVEATGTVTGSIDVVAGPSQISLVSHTHPVQGSNTGPPA